MPALFEREAPAVDRKRARSSPSPAGTTTVTSSVYGSTPASLNNLAATITLLLRAAQRPGLHCTTFRRCGEAGQTGPDVGQNGGSAGAR